MGLDQYAYKIRAELAADASDTDEVMTDLIRLARNMKVYTKEELDKLPRSERSAYLNSEVELVEHAIADGILDKNFAYWRKFYALQAWMRNLYIDKGGIGEFNCDAVRIISEDLDKLQKACTDYTLLHYKHPDFGNELLDHEGVEEIQHFISKSRQAINEGFALFYYSWW